MAYSIYVDRDCVQGYRNPFFHKISLWSTRLGVFLLHIILPPYCFDIYMITLYKFHNHRMQPMFLICLGIMAFYGLLSMQPDNFTHPSRSRVPHPYLGVGLCGETNYRNYLNITANFRLFFPRPHQDLGMCRQTTQSQHMEMISTLYASVSGETNSLHYWNITYHSRVFLPYGYLDLGLSRQTTLYKDSEMICTIFANFASLLMVATFVSLCFTGCRRCDNKRRGKRRKLRSCVWTRRLVYWLQKRVSRTEYIGLALRNKSAARNCVEMKPSQTTSTSVATSFAKTAPQWIKIGSEFPSDCIGDGPVSSEEYDPQKDQINKRKRNVAKAQRKLRRKRKQRDLQYRSSEYAQRTNRGRGGDDIRTGEFKQRS